MSKSSRVFILVLIAGLSCTPSLMAQQKPESPEAEKAGNKANANAVAAPYSDLASPEAKRNFLDFTRGFERLAAFPPASSIEETRRRLDTELMIPGLNRLRSVFDVKIVPEVIGGVQTDVVVPAGGVSPANRNRVLINLHGGGFTVAARYGGQMESVPIASLGAIKVITVDYRMAPEHRYPAATEDVAKVYRELLKSYAPENIGIYGCSAGAVLTAQSIAWFQTHDLPRPGAAGLFGAAALVDRRGDSNYFSALLSGKEPAPAVKPNTLSYFSGANLADPMVSPAHSPAILKKFPPTLLLSGTRDSGLSPVVHTHARLVQAGVEADLHIWEGAPHCSFAQPVVDPDVPETREAWDVIVRFFNKHLGRKGAPTP